jgi:urease accessory protein UreF
MAKKAQTTETSPSSSTGHSVLAAAFAAFEAGDSATTRTLAKAVLAGKLGRDDEAQARVLGPRLSAAGAVVESTPAAVAADLLSRTAVMPKAYAFALLAAAVWVSLVTLAHFRT